MILNALFSIGVIVDKYVIWKPFLKKTKNPMATQEKVLMGILKKNRGTAFGKKFNFNSLKSYAEYKNAVPIQSYEDLRPYVDEQMQKGTPMLTAEQPILYARTSGSTGKPKFIPILRSTITAHKWSQRIFLYPQYEAYPRMYHGKVLVIASPAIEGKLENGIPYGSMSGLIYKEMPWFMKRKFVLPFFVFSIEAYDLKYFVIALLSLTSGNITNMTSANPSTFLKLLDVINERREDLVEVIRTGSLSKLQGLTEAEQREFKRYFRKDERRADELEALFQVHPHITYEHLFKNLQVISTWLAGSCGALVPVLKQNIPATTHLVEVGYLASEFRGSITVDVIHNYAIPAFHETFLEFVEKSEFEKGVLNMQCLDTLAMGAQYYIFITTGGGLYRYNMNDIIEVTGLFNKTPVITFIQKGKGTTNITGEKLYESQVVKAMDHVGSEALENIKFFIMVADEKELGYRLYVEGALLKGDTSALIQAIDTSLSTQNIEYEAKRKSGRLKELQVFFLKHGTGEEYKKHEIKNGMRENQFKMQPLLYKRDITFPIQDYIV